MRKLPTGYQYTLSEDSVRLTASSLDIYMERLTASRAREDKSASREVMASVGAKLAACAGATLDVQMS